MCARRHNGALVVWLGEEEGRMERAGERSWRLTVGDNSTLLHLALFVRDSCQLVVPEDPFVPPPGAGELSDCSAGLGPEARREAGTQWLSWWRRIQVFEAAEALGTLEAPDAPDGRIDAMVIVHQHLFDWPELSALASWPELCRAVRASRDDAVRWAHERGRHLAARDPRSRGLSHLLPIETLAQAVARRAGVPAGRVRAAVSILALRGDWSAQPLPGLLLCSDSLAADAARLGPLVEAAFLSGIDAPPVALPAREPRQRPLPPSVISSPLVLWQHGEASLRCARVIPYHDGFEIELVRRGIGPPLSDEWRGPGGGRRPDAFSGLQVSLRFADGREELLDDIDRADREGPITITTFRRRDSGDDTLWLWVMPLPPPGDVRLTAQWQDVGVEPVSVVLDGATIRPAAA